MSTYKARKAAPKVTAPKAPHAEPAPQSDKAARLLARMEKRIDRSGGPDACHISTYKIDSNLTPNTVYQGVKMTRARAMWMLIHGDDSIPEGRQVLHKCHNKLCLNQAHHYIGTIQQNMLDSARAGTQGKRKLNADKARQIFKLHYVGGKGQVELAKMFGVTPENIRHVTKRRSWVKATDDLVHLMQKPKAKKARKSRPAYQPELRA